MTKPIAELRGYLEARLRNANKRITELEEALRLYRVNCQGTACCRAREVLHG